MTRLRGLLTAVALVVTSVIGVAATATSAGATYPGHDGKIAFVRANQIYTMTSTGGSVTKLTTSGKNYRPHWSPDGKRIAYINETTGGAKDVWVMSATGTTKQRVTTTGDVTSAGAAWSPDGARLALAKPDADGFGSVLNTIPSTSPFGAPTQVVAPHGDQGGWCEQTDPEPVYVDRFIAWSTDNVISVLNGWDCQLDHAIFAFHPASGDYQELVATGGDCCGYLQWTDLFYGPTGKLGLTEKNLGDELETPNAPTHVEYPYSPSAPSTFVSANNDTGGSPSPSGTYLALTHSSSGTAQVFRANVDGSGRRLLTNGYQPDWQRVA
jgi:hypothetical protein